MGGSHGQDVLDLDEGVLHTRASSVLRQDGGDGGRSQFEIVQKSGSYATKLLVVLTSTTNKCYIQKTFWYNLSQ